MFDPRFGKSRQDAAFFLSNWEEDIYGVEIEATRDDPSGFRAIFLKKASPVSRKDKDTYSLGASLLAKRLECLRKAGYDAPMTCHAMEMVEEAKAARAVAQ